MAELPTVASATTTPEAARALAGIEAAKLLADKDVTECLDAIGDLIRITGAPEAIFTWVRRLFARENLRQYAAQQHLKLHESRAADEEQLNRTVVIWTVGGEGLAIVPPGQDPATSLLHLRQEIAQRAEDQQRAVDFQASVAAGLVEDADTWNARTTQAKK
jgi:hypothetical protein